MLASTRRVMGELTAENEQTFTSSSAFASHNSFRISSTSHRRTAQKPAVHTDSHLKHSYSFVYLFLLGVREDRRGLTTDLDDVFFGAAFLDEAFLAGAFLAGAALAGAAAFLEEDFFAGLLAFLAGAGAASIALVVGLRSRFGRAEPLADFDEKMDATIKSTCTTMPRARIPTVTPAMSASGESILVSAFLAAALAAVLTAMIVFFFVSGCIRCLFEMDEFCARRKTKPTRARADASRLHTYSNRDASAPSRASSHRTFPSVSYVCFLSLTITPSIIKDEMNQKIRYPDSRGWLVVTP